jgi:hypothetical protein
VAAKSSKGLAFGSALSGYVAAMRAAAANAVARGFLLQADTDRLETQAAASDVLNP